MKESRRKPTEVEKLCDELSSKILPESGINLNTESEDIKKLGNILLEFRDNGKWLVGYITYSEGKVQKTNPGCRSL